MVAATNITVKKADGTTDVVYTLIAASGGDKQPAVWRNNSMGNAAGYRAELRESARLSGDGSSRAHDLRYTYPVTVTGSDGKTVVFKRANFTLTGSVPLEMTDADVNEAVYQFFNLVASTLVKSSVASGFAPT